MNPRWLLCESCERTHRLGRACPPPVPATPWLEPVAEAYWVGLEVEMREARTLEIVGLAASLSRTRSTNMAANDNEPRVAWPHPRGSSNGLRRSAVEHDSQPPGAVHDEAA